MLDALKDAIRFAAETHGGLPEAHAKRYVADMVREGRLLEERWS